MSKIKLNNIFSSNFTTVLVTGDLFISNSLQIKEASSLKEDQGYKIEAGDDIAIHLLFNEEDPKIIKRGEVLAKKLALLSTPVSILRTYAKNIIHDFRGPLNGIAATLNFMKDKMEVDKELDDTMQAQIDESRKAINDNLALIGLGKPSELTMDDLKVIIEGFIHRYYELSFELDVEECNDHILLSKDVFTNSVSLIFQQILSFYGEKVVKISLSHKDNLKLSIEVKKDLEEFVEELVFYENNGPMHSLCFLRLMVDRLSLAYTPDCSILSVEWDCHETN